MSVKWWCTSSSSWCGEAVAIMLDITSARYFDGCAWMHAPHEVGFLPRITRYHKTWEEIHIAEEEEEGRKELTRTQMTDHKECNKLDWLSFFLSFCLVCMRQKKAQFLEQRNWVPPKSSREKEQNPGSCLQPVTDLKLEQNGFIVLGQILKVEQREILRPFSRGQNVS